MLCAKLFLILSFFVLMDCKDPRSALYMDNGFDQTTVYPLSKQEKREVEHEILNLLGLSSRPRHVANSTLKGGSAPRFLLDVYKSMLDNPRSRSTRSEFNLGGRDLQSIDESDVIMSFSSLYHHVSGVRHERGKRLWFDVSEVPAGETIVGVELRIYQMTNVSIKPATGLVVTLYQVLDTDGERELEVVDSVNTTTGNEGWLLFNVTGAFASWVAIPSSNKGLYLSVHLDTRNAHEMRTEEAGLVTTATPGSEERQPFMVAFFKSSNPEKRVRSRRTREAERRRNAGKKSDSESTYNHNPLLDTAQHWSARSCQLQTLYVSFRDLDWQDWIISPDGYGASYCSGECNFPLNAHMNATNHAIVQTLVHLMNPLKVPKPCCAPTKLWPILVLYHTDEYSVTLKKYKNMAVKSCGCH